MTVKMMGTTRFGRIFWVGAALLAATVATPAAAHWVFATDAAFQYQAGQAGIGKGQGNDDNALGNTRDSSRSLGLGGAAVFGFDTAFTGQLRFWDQSSGTGQWPSNLSVFVGNSWNFDDPNFKLDLSEWTSVGTLGQPDARNGSTLKVPGVFQYLLIVDNGSRTRGRTPFNVTRVSVLPGSTHSLPAPAAVPIPGAVWLFGSALLGLAAVARRRANHRLGDDQAGLEHRETL
jgi:hypothetical protein